MTSGKIKSLFQYKNRKTIIILSVLIGFLCVLLMRYFQDTTFKITMLYVVNICAILLVIAYKNSLNEYEVGIFCFLCVQLLALAPLPGNLDVLVATSYLLPFRYGVSSRSFAATIVDFLTNGGFVSKYFVWHFLFSSTIYLSFIISVFLGTIINKAGDGIVRKEKDKGNDVKIFVIFLVFLYLSCFTAPSANYVQENFGRVEIFSFLLMLLLMVIIEKPVIRWMIPLFALIVMATHLVLLFFYIPFIFMLLLYWVINKTDKNKRYLFLLLTTITVTIAAFFCYYFLRKDTFVFDNANAFYNYLSTKSDLNFDAFFLHMTLFASLQEHLNHYRNIVGSEFYRNIIHVVIIINIPMLLLFVVFWIKCFCHETEKMMKKYFLLPIILLFFQSPVFFMFFDFGRWMILIINIQFMLVLYFIFVKNKTVLSVASSAVPIIKKYKIVILIIGVTMLFFGPVNCILPSDRVLHLVNRIVRNFQFLSNLR